MRNSSANPENQKLKIGMTLTPPTVSQLSADKMPDLYCDNIQKYSRPIGFLYFYRPINIILSADWSDYIKDITRNYLNQSQNFTIGRSSAHSNMTSADLSADHRPIAKTPKLSADGKNYNKVVIIYFFVGR